MTQALLFPGQGSQSIGMGKALAAAFPEARLVFEEVDDALGQKLSTLMFEGPADELTLTENAQPAIMASAVAVYRVLEKQSGKALRDLAAMLAGHSLGEYSALTVAGVFPLADTARLLRLRGRAMQQAVKPGEGAMAAMIGAELPEIEKLTAAASTASASCDVANDNSPGQIVISGHKEAIDKAIAMAKDYGIRKAVPLQVSAPFHCRLMQPAAESMREVLAKQVMRTPSLPIMANVTAQRETDPETLRDLLVQQVTGRVRWRESVANMAALGTTRFIELGAGKVLTGLVKRIAPEAEALCLESPQDIEALLTAA